MSENAMKHKAKPRDRNLLAGLLIAVAILILLLRMMVFVTGRGRHHF